MADIYRNTENRSITYMIKLTLKMCNVHVKFLSYRMLIKNIHFKDNVGFECIAHL